MTWQRKAADQGLASAQWVLGVSYETGQGVPHDDAEAVKWYRKAADQGFANAMLNLGFMYVSGRGVPQNSLQAHVWFNLAAARLPDNEERKLAVESRDMVAAKLTPTQIAEAQRLAREWTQK